MDTPLIQDSSIATEIASCQLCPLYQDVVSPVRGEGPQDAKIIFVGRNPGNDEDRFTRPFVGRSGQLLNEWMGKVGYKRNQVGIVNMVKCFTPGNRPPTQTEIESCKVHLRKELEFFDKAKILILMGSDVVQTLMQFKEKQKITHIAGKIYRAGRFHVFIMYHPSYVLRNPAEKKRFFNYFAPKTKNLAERLEII